VNSNNAKYEVRNAKCEMRNVYSSFPHPFFFGEMDADAGNPVAGCREAIQVLHSLHESLRSLRALILTAGQTDR